MRKHLIFAIALVSIMCLLPGVFARSVSSTDTGVLGNQDWSITSGGDLVSNTSGKLVVDGALDIGTVETFTDEDATPDVGDGSYFVTNTTTDTITDFDGSDIVAGQIIVIESAGAITYDVTGEGLAGGTTDLVTADGDLTSWIYNGTDWLLISFMDLSDDMS